MKRWSKWVLAGSLVATAGVGGYFAPALERLYRELAVPARDISGDVVPLSPDPMNVFEIKKNVADTVESILNEKGYSWKISDERSGTKESEKFIFENADELAKKAAEKLNPNERLVFYWMLRAGESPFGKRLLYPYVSKDRKKLVYRTHRNYSHGIAVDKRGHYDWEEDRFYPFQNPWPEDISWSPDGKNIVFQALMDGPIGDIWVMNEDGTNPRNLTDSVCIDEGCPGFLPDGRIIYSAVELEELKPYEGRIRAIAGKERRMNIFDTNLVDIDSETCRQVDHKLKMGRYDVWVMNSDGSGKACLTGKANLPGGKIFYPTFTDDGVVFELLSKSLYRDVFAIMFFQIKLR